MRAVASSGDEKNERYAAILDRTEEMVRQIAQVPIPPDGHLGVLRLARSHFNFLFEEYGFTVIDQQPTCFVFTRGEVVTEVGWATQSSLSFSIRRGDLGGFWIDDLLYLNQDQRFKSVPQALQLTSETAVDVRFRFLSSGLRQYGEKLLTDAPSAFDQLAGAQSQRDTSMLQK